MKLLKLASFVQKNFKADLIRKAHVVQLLIMAARACRSEKSLEIPENWAISEEIKTAYRVEADHGKKSEN